MRLRSGMAVAVAQAGGYSFNLTLSLGNSICLRCSPKKTHTHTHTHTQNPEKNQPSRPQSHLCSAPSHQTETQLSYSFSSPRNGILTY